MNSVWERIYRHLRDNGIEVYSTGQHKGDCTSPYTVVKASGSGKVTGFSSDVAYFDLMMYVPISNYSELDPYVNKVKSIMKSLRPMIRESHYETPDFPDDTNNSHMRSVQYECWKKFYNTR